MKTNECWACRDSRAVCDHARPRCSRCASSNRQCQYGLRLSWPKATSTKRSLTHSVQDVSTATQRVSHASFVNTTSWDIHIHRYIRMNQGFDGHGRFVPERLHPPTALPWLPINLGYENRELLDHFIRTASSTLAIFEPDKKDFLSLLLRMACSDSSPSSAAVLQAALALSSFHRHGLQADVLQFKEGSLRILMATCSQAIDGPTVLQHIAARMILCHLEMAENSSDLSLWFCHMSHAKFLIENAGVDSQSFNGELSKLLAWVEYHTVTSRFSLRHWHLDVEPIKTIRNVANANHETCLSREVKGISSCSHEILRLLYVMFEIIQRPTSPQYHSEAYENTLRCLENRITNIVPSVLEDDTVSDLNTAWVATTELFKLATLIYLKRASRNFFGASPQIEAMVERAYTLLDDLRTFNLAFPLLIVGCEARTDEQRMRMLHHIERVMTTSRLKSLHELRSILQQAWVQDDLAVSDLEYVTKLDTIISSYQILPSFA